MNKAQLIDAIAEKAGLTKADSKKALEAFVATIKREILFCLVVSIINNYSVC